MYPIENSNYKEGFCSNENVLGSSGSQRINQFHIILISNTRLFHDISNTEKRVENATASGVFLTNFEVFDIAMKHCDECLI